MLVAKRHGLTDSHLPTSEMFCLASVKRMTRWNELLQKVRFFKVTRAQARGKPRQVEGGGRRAIGVLEAPAGLLAREQDVDKRFRLLPLPTIVKP